MPKFTEEQQRAIDLEGENILVSAGAGSGKTAVLSERVLRKVMGGVPVNQLLILTFTKKAASEMKERIRKKLRKANLTRQLELLDSSFITTFDAYSMAIVKKYADNLNISSNLEVMDDVILSLKEDEIIDEIFKEYYDKKDSPYYKQFIPPHIWKQMLEATYTYCDGSIIWSSRTDENDQSVFWEDLRVQQIWEVTKHFIHSHKRQIVFPEKENLSILTSTPQEFNIYLNTNHPQLAQYGVQTIQMINEKDLGNCTNETFVLDVDKVKQFAIQTPKSSNTPICIAPINKKSDTLDYQEIYKLLKKDNGNQIWQISSTSLGKLRLHNSNMHVNMGSWAINTMNSPQEPEKFTDAIIINAPIVDNDTITWKKELYITIKEAQFKSEGKPIYVYLPTTSLNNNYTIKATEWKTALKTAQQWCNGIIIHDINNNLPDTNTAIWQESLKFIKEMKNTVD